MQTFSASTFKLKLKKQKSPTNRTDDPECSLQNISFVSLFCEIERADKVKGNNIVTITTIVLIDRFLIIIPSYCFNNIGYIFFIFIFFFN